VDRFVGTGPYRLVSSSPQKQSLLPFERYWGPPPRNRGLHLVTLSNSTALFGALVSGEVDVLTSSGMDSDQQRALAQRAQQGRLVEGIGPAGEIGYLTLLSDRPPLNRPLLRQAVALSLDRELISQRVSYGIRAPLRSLVPPPLTGSEPPAWPAYNPTPARQLYQQAGYCKGKRFTLPLTFRSNVPADKLFALTWKAQLQRDLGDCVQLEITGVESTTAYRQLADGAFPMILFDWSADYPDPDIYLAPMLACSKPQGQQCLEGNAAAAGSFWSAPGLQAELEASERLSGRARLPLLRKLQQRTAAAAAYIPVWQVAPRAWAQPELRQPVFDGSGRLVLQALSVR
jgi:peptide/nickel transport system substrate-binding protein